MLIAMPNILVLPPSTPFVPHNLRHTATNCARKVLTVMLIRDLNDIHNVGEYTLIKVCIYVDS